MKTIFYFPEDKALAEYLAKKMGIDLGVAEIRNFPDGETYIRIISQVKNKSVILICRLDHPNNKILPLFFMAKKLKELGALNICLIAPYLPYMRQDKSFKASEVVSASVFAQFLSSFIDQLITIDPHLHRIKDLSEIFSVPAITIHLTRDVAEWIRANIDSPCIIGPDEESKQWVIEVAKSLDAPFIILEKIRYSDSNVKISIPVSMDITKTPVLLDDIISTGGSMVATIRELINKGFKPPVCIGMHALFNKNNYNKIMKSGAKKVITSNSILNFSNEIDIGDVIFEKLKFLK